LSNTPIEISGVEIKQEPTFETETSIPTSFASTANHTGYIFKNFYI
jgi:hypothetical protein